MTQENNSQNPYANVKSESQFQSTVEQSAAYQSALAREKAQQGNEAQAQISAQTPAQEQPQAVAEPVTQAAAEPAVQPAAQAGTQTSAQAGSQTAAQPANQPAQLAQPYNLYANPNNPYAQQGAGQNAWAPQQPVAPSQIPTEVSGNAGANGTNATGASNAQNTQAGPAGANQPDFSPESMNFFKKEEDPTDMSPGLKWGTRIGWFAIGLVAGIFGIMIAWISSASLSKKYRRQAMMAAWLGLVAQAALYMFLTFSGIQIPFLPQTQTGAASSAATSAAGASSGANAFG